ncbi:hypothetical protein [Thermoanaerobacterium butyriciformans]|uniref:Uncharacterized protein n=1 Tax=Thermoanaerobacterium butyriciformans TaxID=1702242 RepID=A0ABS4NG47_9THEO|nr:hypothetical protein [Thermoanaerobacterium butyriciformans]MBP2072635.1 hypothetical protein [Thermoanaerobacterium butyriciformans]
MKAAEAKYHKIPEKIILTEADECGNIDDVAISGERMNLENRTVR